MPQIKIDTEKCIGCGTCVGISPEHFELGNDGKSHVKKQYNDKDKNIIKEAVESCPVDAISLE